MTLRERLLNVLNGKKTDRIPVSIFISDSDIEDGLADCILSEKSGDTISDLIRFNDILGLDAMLRIGINVYEPIGFDRNTDNWKNIWELKDNGRLLVHRIITPDGDTILATLGK